MKDGADRDEGHMSTAPVSIVRAIDRRLGRAVGGAVVAHHRRRLRRLARLGALDAPSGGWAKGATPPRPGSSLEILTDGAEALPRIVEELRKARSHVHLAGWHVAPEFALTRGNEPTIVRSLLGELSSRIDVRVLTWGGAPLPLFRPSRREVRRARERCCARSRVDWALDSKERPLHCHHEKTIVIDDRLAFVGGIDLTAESGDRFDSVSHVARGQIGWHDVASCVTGPAVADVAEHFRMRWREVRGETIAPVAAIEETGDLEIQIVRTIPEGIYAAVPRGDFGILESYVRSLRGARRLIYLENQFLWSPEITTIIADKLRRPPDDRFRVLIVLPSKPNTGADDTRGSLAELIEADNGAGRLLACALFAHQGAFSDPIYVHAKVGIVDDHWLTIGSANLNDHSLFNDTEMNVVIHDTSLATDTRLRLWAEHLELPVSAVDGDPASVIDTLWKPISALQLGHLSTGRPLTRRPVRLPNVSRRSERLLGPLQGLLVDG
jgi:phosphatidylserine/phosphatidylglycerophosphate/cardiolipin synthase-like enzyme